MASCAAEVLFPVERDEHIQRKFRLPNKGRM